MLPTDVARAQADPDSTREEVRETLERALEDFDPTDPNFDTEELTQFLQELAANPVNLNTASLDRLMLVPAFNLKLAQGIIKYRESVKPFERVEELQKVSGIGRITLTKARPYVTIGKGGELQRVLLKDPRYWTYNDRFEYFSRYQQTLQQQAGYATGDSSGYLGSPMKYYQRARYQSNHLSVNITQEKDPGEPFRGDLGFDYTSFHVAATDVGRFSDIVVGDYSVSFGQGLVLWSGGAFGKGSDVVGGLSKNERGIRGYTSAQESNYMRGVGASVNVLPRLKVTGFWSNAPKSSSYVTADSIRMPSASGYHRTESEWARRHNVSQMTTGGRIRYRSNIGLFGVSGYYAKFSDPVAAGTRLYNQYDFSGISHSVVGVDYRLVIRDILLFGEAARSQNGGWGAIGGVQAGIPGGGELALGVRNYEKDFQSFLGVGFGESSGAPQNEFGVYVGWAQPIARNMQLSVYFDQYEHPAPSFRVDQPSNGFDLLGRFEHEVSRTWSWYLQVRHEEEGQNFDELLPGGRLITRLDDGIRSSVRMEQEYWVQPKVRLRLRGEWIQSQLPGEDREQGYLIYQDIRVVPSERWTIDARYTMFDTDSYDTRLYQFENDLLYVMSNTMLYERGQRMYVLVNYEPFDFLEAWAKIGVTIYDDEQTISSGLNEIQGDTRTDVGVQVRVRL
jgi:competence ComEA-like helix-hairpin-helix protein